MATRAWSMALVYVALLGAMGWMALPDHGSAADRSKVEGIVRAYYTTRGPTGMCELESDGMRNRDYQEALIEDSQQFLDALSRCINDLAWIANGRASAGVV